MVLMTRSASSTLPRRHSSWGGIKINQPTTPIRCVSTETAQPSVFQTQAMPRALPTRRESLDSEPPPRKTPPSTPLSVKSDTTLSKRVCDVNVISPISATSSNRFPRSSLPAGRSSMNLDPKNTKAQTGEHSSRKRRFSSGVSFYSDVIEKQRLQQRPTRNVHEDSSESGQFMKIHELIQNEMRVISVTITRLTAVITVCFVVVTCALVLCIVHIGMAYKDRLAK